jgi:hypothetical protein
VNDVGGGGPRIVLDKPAKRNAVDAPVLGERLARLGDADHEWAPRISARACGRS